MAFGNLFGSGGESNSLYGTSLTSGSIPAASSFIYFEWFIFKVSSSQPATPTGGSWDFLTNTGVPPTGWVSSYSGIPSNNMWFSIAFVDSRNPTGFSWSTPGLISAATSTYASSYADKFTGDGSTTAWTLSADPVTINNLDVSVNGVTQTPTTDYTISGTTFTTTTAAPLGSILLVKYRQALPNSYTGASNNISYTPAGSGAVATTVQAKLRQYVSVMDYGAVGDGTTNDTAAIQAALNSGKKSIYFPSGTYVITSTLTVPKGVSLFGSGYEVCILNGYGLSNANAIFSLTGGDQFSTIDNFTFKGQASGSKSIGISVNNGYYVSYTNLRFTNLSYGMYLDEAGSSLIQNCNFTNCLIGAQCMGGSAYKFISCEFQYGTDVGIKLIASPTTGFPTSAIVIASGFTSNVGIDVPRVPGAFGGNSISVDNCYFEGDLNFSTLTKAFRIGETGSGNSVVMASISNCRIAGSNSAKSVFANLSRLYFANNIVGSAMEVQSTVLGAEYIGNEFDGVFTNNTLATLTLDLGTIQTNWIDNATYAQLRLAQGGHGIDVLTTRVRPVVTNEISLGDNAYFFTNAYLTGGLYINSVRWTTGSGSPQGSLSAPVGSMYTRTDGGASTTLYVKESGTGNTGWVAK